MTDAINDTSARRILDALKNARQKIEQLQQADHEAIAIIGIGCRFPGGVDSPESYWQLLSEGKVAVVEVPSQRWDSQRYYRPEPNQSGFTNTTRAAVIDQVDQFDPQFFNISPREAINLDPQQRLVLETAWEALERAGQMPDRLAGIRAGVFIGITANDYGQLSDDITRYDAYFNSGNSLNVAAGRLSYTLGFTGPSMAVDTACSSSLTAVHLACQSLKQRECRLALAGGVNLMLLVQNSVALSQAGMLSPDGRCKTFDAAANGYVRGEGCGIVVLKRLSDALADRDNILAVIRGSAVNQDGASGGLTVPNGLAQQAVIEQALSNAKVSPEMIDYIEAHGTGTPLGDPIEVNALASVFGATHSVEYPLRIGSVKTNIGHLESAAGIAGLIKLVLALQHQQLPKQLHYQSPNPHIDWARLPVKVVDAAMAWPRGDKRRLAGVSAFGFSGTNAHVIVEEAPLPASEAAVAPEPYALLPLSAKSETALQALQQRYLDYFTAHPELDYAAVCYTAAVGRQHFSHRCAILAANIEQARQQLQTLLNPDGSICELSAQPLTDAATSRWHDLQERYLNGDKIDWAAAYGERKAAKVVLPTYPFQRQRYWLEATKRSTLSYHSGHPLLGSKLPSALRTIQYQTVVGPDQPGWLADHRLPPRIVFPATAYLELALAAGRQLLHSDRLTIRDLSIRQALVVDALISLQTLLEPVDDGYRVTVASCQEAEQHQGSWIVHAEARLNLSQSANDDSPAERLAATAMATDSHIDIDAYYQRFRDQGLDYGPRFQGIRRLSVEGRTVTGLLTLAPDDAQQASQYLLHPALLDSCLQLLQAALPEQRTQRYLPVGLEQLTLYRSGSDAAYCQATLNSPAESADYYTADLQLYDPQGLPVAELKQLLLRPAGVGQLSSQPARQLDSYRIAWQAQPFESPNAAADQAHWLVFSEPGALSEQLKTQLPNSHLVRSGSDYQILDARHTQLHPEQPEHYQKLLAEHPETTGILHAWSEALTGLDLSQDADRQLDAAQQTSCASVLHLVQALATTPSPQPRTLTLVTRGAQAVYRCNDDEAETALQSRVSLLQAPLLGLAKVIGLEHPELRCLRIDLDPNANDTVAAEVQQIAGELQRQAQDASSAEDQIAYRHGQRYVPRLQRRSSQADAVPLTGAGHSAPQRHLRLDGIGLDRLQLAESPIPAPKAGQLQIDVTASGLNFKDVLHALGMLEFPGCQTEAIPFGFECAGLVSQLGEGVDGFNIGDRVMAVLTPGSMADHVNVDARYVIRTPDRLSDLDAAALPLAYLTASYGLEQLAQVQPGERILIHAAAGGVGQAAIQIAKLHGLDIYATAHPDKWPLLQAQGIIHLYHSRQADYADAINAATHGHGVDIVLNSLSGEFIAENLRCLAKRGRFIEIGKLGILSPEQMQHQRPDVDYHVFDLGDVGQQQPALIQNLFQRLGERLQQQTLKPLPVQVYPLGQAADAFQCMAQARHQGKIVLNHRPATIKSQHCYLITGGLGGLGLKLAEWLIGHGATHLVLNSLNPANAQVQQQLQALQQQAQVEVIVADIGQQQQAAQLFAQIKQHQPPLVGIFHAAGKLDDGMLQQLDWTRFASVLKPKINGSWHLHRYSQDLSLDFFIEFSSATALLGAPGQGNYAAANAFQDALAHQRRLQGLPALSINWGPWGGVGMAARLSANSSNHWQTQGVEPLNPEAALQALLQVLNDDDAQVALMQIDWPRFSRNYPSALLNDFTKAQTPQNPEPSFIDRLNALPAEQQRDYLNNWLREQICMVLALPKSTPIDPRERLFDFGLDSLMAVELKNRLDNATAKKMRSTLIFDYPTLEALGKHLAEQVQAIDEKKPEQAVGQTLKDQDLFELSGLLDALENSSDDEITQRLMN